MVQAIEVLPEGRAFLRINVGSKREFIDWNSFVWAAGPHGPAGRTLRSFRSVSPVGLVDRYSPAALLVRLAEDREARVRQAAAVSTGKAGGKDGLALLDKLVADQDPSVRSWAADGLGRTGGKKARDLLLARLSAEKDRNVLAAVSGALAIPVLHAGREEVLFPSPGLVSLCRELAEAGAAAVVCHHPHVPQGVELWRGRPIAYSLGNFLFDWPEPEPHTDSSFLLELGLARSGVVEIAVHPFRKSRTGGAELLHGRERVEWLRHLRDVSRPLGDERLHQRLWRRAMPAAARRLVRAATGARGGVLPWRATEGPAVRAAIVAIPGLLLGYASPEEVSSGKLEEYVRGQWAAALGGDPAAKAGTKPLIVGEAGLLTPGFSASNNPLHLKYEYGVCMADYAAQAASAGSWAVLAWMLDDNSHQGFTWGMWANHEKGLKPKPWFYVWALLSRSFPTGSKIVAVTGAPAGFRVLAARIPGAKGDDWSVCLVNRGAAPAKLQLRVPGAGRRTVASYVYSPAAAKADADGFPLPVDSSAADLGTGLALEIPAESVIFLTTAAAH